MCVLYLSLLLPAESSHLGESLQASAALKLKGIFQIKYTSFILVSEPILIFSYFESYYLPLFKIHSFTPSTCNQRRESLALATETLETDDVWVEKD